MRIFRNVQLSIKPGFYILLAMFLLVIPYKWVIAWFVAAAVHEFSHCAALLLCRVKIYSVYVGLDGAEIVTEPMRTHHELISAAAGPVGGLVLLLALRFMPHVALCALFQSAYNLLPVFPLDGGRIMRCCISRVFCCEHTDIICRYIENVFKMILFVMAGIGTFVFNLGMFPLVCAMLLAVKSKSIKFPCKQEKQIVQ